MGRTPVQKISDRQEKRTAETYRGSRNAMSGAGWMRKADVRAHDFLIENKAKTLPNAKSFSVKDKDMQDLTKRAILEGRIPVWQVDINGRRYVVLNEDDFLEMADI